MSNALRMDPTRTGLLQRKLGAELAALVRRLYAEAVARVQEEQPVLNAMDANWLERFGRWLAQRANELVLQPSKRLFARWLGLGVQRGVTRAVVDSRPLPVAKLATQVVVGTVLGTGGSQQRVQVVLQRALAHVQGLTDTTVTGIVRLLADGVQQGQSPKVVAKLIAAKYDVSKSRALTIARTEMIRAHAEGQLIGFEQMGVTTLGVQAEWLTTHDGKACPKCVGMSGKVFTVEEAKGLIPAHPSCRCCWLPNIPTKFLLPEATRAPHRVGRHHRVRVQRGAAQAR